MLSRHQPILKHEVVRRRAPHGDLDRIAPKTALLQLEYPRRDEIPPGNLPLLFRLFIGHLLRIQLQDDVPVEHSPRILDEKAMRMSGHKITLQKTAQAGQVGGDGILPGFLGYIRYNHLFELPERFDKLDAKTLPFRIDPGNDRFALQADRPFLPGEFWGKQKGDQDVLTSFEKTPVLCLDEASFLAQVLAYSISPNPGAAKKSGSKLAV
jgi:hypothetical protein